jgi:FkbM family methyltransferase
MAIPFSLRDRILFGRHGLSTSAQKAVHFLSGYSGPIEYELGGQIGCRFESSAAERYFYARENYERDIQEFITRRVGPGRTVFDVGGHIGFMALLFSSLGARVVTFEPSPVNYTRLQRNLSLNPSRQVIPIHAGASDVSGTGMLIEGGSMSSISTVGDVPIQLVRLDDIATEQGYPDFLKIDVEGHAGSVLGGASNLMERLPDLLIELHSKEEENKVLSTLPSPYKVAPLGAEEEYPKWITASRAS